MTLYIILKLFVLSKKGLSLLIRGRFSSLKQEILLLVYEATLLQKDMWLSIKKRDVSMWKKKDLSLWKEVKLFTFCFFVGGPSILVFNGYFLNQYLDLF